MSKFIGTAGDYMKEKSFRHRVNAITAFFMAFVMAVFVIGWASGYFWGHRSIWSVLFLLLAIGVAIPYFKFLEKKFDNHIRESRKEEKGADGERDFVKFLKDLPDTYTVISDLDFADSYGNIDHLIIGPTGVFAIDVKDWKGTVASDGKGELLLNGRHDRQSQLHPRRSDFRLRHQTPHQQSAPPGRPPAPHLRRQIPQRKRRTNWVARKTRKFHPATARIAP